MLADIGADVERQLGSPLPTDFWDRFDAARRVAFEASLRSIDGAAETVAAIQAAGIRTCVASQGRLSKTELTLGLTGLRSYFAADELFSAYSVRRGKPFPDLFLHAATHMGVRPAESIVVEDSPSGMRAAVAADMDVVAYMPDGGEPPALGAPITPIQRLSELVALVTS